MLLVYQENVQIFGVIIIIVELVSQLKNWQTNIQKSKSVNFYLNTNLQQDEPIIPDLYDIKYVWFSVFTNITWKTKVFLLNQVHVV